MNNTVQDASKEAPKDIKSPKSVQTSPWKPATVLHAKLKDSSFTLRWCTMTNMTKKIAEGWVVVKPDELLSSSTLPLDFGTVIDGTIRRGNLILCKMHKDIASSRNKYYHDQAKDLLKASKKEFETDADHSTYGEIKVERI